MKRKRKRITIILLIFLSLMTSAIFLFSYVDKRLSPLFFSYASIEIKRMMGIVVNEAMKEILSNYQEEEFLTLTMNDKKEIKTVDFNTLLVNEVLFLVTTNIQNYLKRLESGDLDKIAFLKPYDFNYLNSNSAGLVFKIPTGAVSHNIILSSLGVKIPIRLKTAGSLNTNLKTVVTNYGINNALVGINMEISLSYKMILPFSDEEVTFQFSTPLILKVITGAVPNYYASGISQNSPLVSIPLE